MNKNEIELKNQFKLLIAVTIIFLNNQMHNAYLAIVLME